MKLYNIPIAIGIFSLTLQAQLPSSNISRPTSQIFTPPILPLPACKFLTQVPGELIYKEVAELFKAAENLSQLSLEELETLQKRHRDLANKFKQITFPSTETRREVYRSLQNIADLIIKEIKNRLQQTQVPKELTYEKLYSEVTKLLKEAEQLSQLSLEELETFQKRHRDLANTFKQITFPSTETRREVYRSLQSIADLIITEIENRLPQTAPAQPTPVQPGPRVQPEARPEQPTSITIAGREIDPTAVIKNIVTYLNNIKTLELHIQAVSRPPITQEKLNEKERLTRLLRMLQRMSTQDVLRSAFGIPGIHQVTNPTDIENIKRIRNIALLEALEQPDRERVLDMLTELVQTLPQQ